MKFSVILPSLLTDYPGSAVKKDQKLVRAIDSVLNQSYSNLELIVVSDGCDATTFIVSRMNHERLRFHWVRRRGMWSNDARNAGINLATGDYIIYIDNDDQWGPDHLKTFYEGIKENGSPDWVYSNDLMLRGEEWIERVTDVSQYGRCGTSNICHARRLNETWGETGYGHDFKFIQKLRKYENNFHIKTAQYYVCHIHGLYEI